MFKSTRSGATADSTGAILRGLAPDGGLYMPQTLPGPVPPPRNLAEAEKTVLEAFFPDIPAEVRAAAVARLLARFPENPVPLAAAGDRLFLELFHGPTGAFKDVALSMLPVLLAHSAEKESGKRVLVLTATSGDTGSAAMAGFAGCDGASVAVFYPGTGMSRIQRLQMTTQSAPNVKAFAINGNFDDAQSAVKRIFSSPEMRAFAEGEGAELSSANSINIARLVPQIAYYLLLPALAGAECDVAVPSGNFGNILAAYIAKRMGAKIGTLICASNENRALEGFIRTGTYDARPALKVTNSPSMDIRKSSNAERLLWLLLGGDGEAVARLAADLDSKGRYTLPGEAFDALREDFSCGFATQEETLEEMRRIRKESGYYADPHTAVASAAARKAGFPRAGRPLAVAATATPFKFPETCAAAFGDDAPRNPPPSIAGLETMPVAQTARIEPDAIPEAVRACLRARR